MLLDLIAGDLRKGEIMARLHHCSDGTPITEKVLMFQADRKGDDYLPIYRYYNNFKDKWHLELQDFLDRSTFDAEFDFKLCRAVDSFDETQARLLCEKYKWSFLGAFNRWFYAVLRNWKSNVKTSAFRQKKRPSVQCPVCGRYVPKIDEIHLAHIKTKSDLPKAFSWKSNIYSVVTTPDLHVTCWGKYSHKKLAKINKGDIKGIEKERVEWMWYTKDGTRGVVCPFTKKIVPDLSNEYIAGLPKQYNRYAKVVTWQEFVEEFPNPVLIQAEIYSLDYNSADEDASLQNTIATSESLEEMGYEDIENNRVPGSYEHVFHLIESTIEDETDKKVAKLVVIGYSDSDIASTLDIDKKEVRQRKRDLRSHSSDLKEKLQESV